MDEKLEKTIDFYQGKPGAILSILEDIQEAYGYLPKKVLEQVSEKLNTHLIKYPSVSTF